MASVNKEYLDETGLALVLNNLKSLFIESSEKGANNGVATLGSDGVIPLSLIPKAALDHLCVVATEADRFRLTKNQVQTGDTVKVLVGYDELPHLYLVADDTKLDQSAGYEEYASSAQWSTIAGKPSNLCTYEDTGEVITINLA